MRLANLGDRAVFVISDELGIDVHRASGGRFGPDLPPIYDAWDEFHAWGTSADLGEATVRIDVAQLGSPSPAPRQIFAIGLNYRAHAVESGFALPEGMPPVFTKFLTSISGPFTAVELPPSGQTDWEVELVVIVGREARHVPEHVAWDVVAGLAVGQDISERQLQLEGPAPQFSMGKSFPGFSPIGPWLVTSDEVPDRDDLELGCSVDGEQVQLSRTSDLLLSVPALIARLSAVVTLLPGDVIFTGTPSGVGLGRKPQRFLRAGERLVSWVEGIGRIEQRFVAPD